MDVNATIGGLLRDLSFVQTSREKAFGYRRAAAAILSLDDQWSELIQPGCPPPKIPGIGPASMRVILEVLEMGTSPTVERAVTASGRAAEVRERRRLRTHVLSRACVRAILTAPRMAGPKLADYRGDLQMHSEWSDGAASLEEIVEACRSRGYSFAAVTDHSHGLAIAGGMSMEQAAAQRAAIDRMNAARGAQFFLIRGVEANLGPEGTLDLTEHEVAQFELVLAAAHSRLRRTEDQTARLEKAVRHPGVHVLAHPRGRIAGSRAGIVADWAAVFALAAREGVAVEIDGDPARQDLDYGLAREALAAGCLFALDSDAHTTSQLAYAETALAHARLAAIPPDRIVNCWPLDRLLAWLSDRSSEALL